MAMNAILIIGDENLVKFVQNELIFVYFCWKTKKKRIWNRRAAPNGIEALEALENDTFDCVLMDVQMPLMDGYSAIRKQPQYKNLPIIALSANVMAGDREKTRAAGMDDHIGKPFKKAEMFAAMARLIARL